jgi:hypothetical protein
MRPRVDFQRRVGVPELDNLSKVHPQECGDRTVLLVLMDVPQFVRQKPCVLVPATNEDGVAEGQAHHSWTEQSGFKRRRSQCRLFGQRQGTDNFDPDKLRLAHPYAERYLLLRCGERIANLRR